MGRHGAYSELLSCLQGLDLRGAQQGTTGCWGRHLQHLGQQNNKISMFTSSNMLNSNNNAQQKNSIRSSCLFPISIYSVSGDADSIGGPSSIYSDWQPADEGNSWRRTALQLYIERSIRGTCRNLEYHTKVGGKQIAQKHVL